MPRTIELKFDVGEKVWALPYWTKPPHSLRELEVCEVKITRFKPVPHYLADDGDQYLEDQLYATREEAEREAERRNGKN